jgi:hypothetical protein
VLIIISKLKEFTDNDLYIFIYLILIVYEKNHTIDTFNYKKLINAFNKMNKLLLIYYSNTLIKLKYLIK